MNSTTSLLGPDMGRGLAVRAAPRSVRFSGTAAIARFLDSSSGAVGPSGGRISEILASGSARSLSQAIDQLNPTERNALQARWGRSLEELISLSNERDARVFHHGLLQVGRRLEDGDRIDLAGVVYSGLVAEGSNSPHPPLNLRGGEEVVPPLRLRGGQEGLLSSEVATQAQRRLNAINGVGDWRERFAFSLQRIPNQATRWDVLLAMTGAGFTFRGFRLLTTASWAGSFESALALNAASASTAFLAETIAFTSLGKVAGALAGHPQDTSANGIFNEWAGGAAMLLGLKGMGAITGAGVRSIYGEGLAATATGRLTQILAPQVGMFMGILVGNRLAEAGGFHPGRHGDTWLVDGITTLIEFNVAGRIQRVAGGPALSSLEARMEAMTRNIGHGFGRPGEIWDGRSKDRPLPGIFESMSEWMQPGLVTSEGLSLPTFENRKSKIENLHIVYSMGGNNNGDGNDPRTRPTLPGFSGAGGGERVPRTTTLTGMGGEARRPRAASAQFFAQGQPYTVAEAPEGSILIRVHDNGRDLIVQLTDTIETALKAHLTESLVILYEGDAMTRAVQGRFRVDLHRVLREKLEDGNRRVVVMIPAEKSALVFQKNHGIVAVRSVPLEIKGRQTSPDLRRPGSEGSDRSSSVPPQPGTLRPPSSLPPPRPPSPIPPLPAGEDSGSMMSYLNFSELREGFRRVLQSPPAGIFPTLRTQRGVLGIREMDQLIDVMDAASLPDGKKIVLCWTERGGGRLIFARQGDRIVVSSVGYPRSETRYQLFLHPTVNGGFRLVPESQVREYSFTGLASYRQNFQSQVETMARSLDLALGEVGDARSEEGMLRGQMLARVAKQLVSEATRNGPLSEKSAGILLRLHQLLEQAYLVFDFETIQRFRETMGAERLKVYERLVSQRNLELETGVQPLLIPLQEMPITPELEYAIPKIDTLRQEWLHHLFTKGGGTRSPGQNRFLLNDPALFGQSLAAVFRQRLENIGARVNLLKLRNRGMSLDQLLRVEEDRLSPDSALLHREIRAALPEITEFARIFSEVIRGRHIGAHRQMLRAAFSGRDGIFKTYSQIFEEFSGLSEALRPANLLPPEAIRKYVDLLGRYSP